MATALAREFPECTVVHISPGPARRRRELNGGEGETPAYFHLLCGAMSAANFLPGALAAFVEAGMFETSVTMIEDVQLIAKWLTAGGRMLCYEWVEAAPDACEPTRGSPSTRVSSVWGILDPAVESLRRLVEPVWISVSGFVVTLRFLKRMRRALTLAGFRACDIGSAQLETGIVVTGRKPD